jgi:DNA-binding NarL/FixJ family response regulator
MQNNKGASTNGVFSLLVVDDHPIVRHGIVQLLRRAPRLRVCGQAGDRVEALEKVNSLSPDVVLLDLFLQGAMATDLIQTIREAHPDIKILVISMQNEAFFAEKALEAGAKGYVVKEEATKKIVEAVGYILAGKRFVSESVFNKMLHKVVCDGASSQRSLADKLSRRELQIFQMLGRGNSSRQIAETLSLNLKTVETYYSRIKGKMNLKDLRELTFVAIRWDGLE